MTNRLKELKLQSMEEKNIQKRVSQPVNQFPN